MIRVNLLMKKKVSLLIAGFVTLFAMGTAAYAKTEDDKTAVPILQNESYITIIRASGEVEIYPLDGEFLEMRRTVKTRLILKLC